MIQQRHGTVLGLSWESFSADALILGDDREDRSGDRAPLQSSNWTELDGTEKAGGQVLNGAARMQRVHGGWFRNDHASPSFHDFHR